jgi:Matrixin
MSWTARRSLALAAAALTTAGLALVPASASVSAAPRPVAHLSEADALWLPAPNAVRQVSIAPARLVSTVSNAYRFSSLLDGQPVRWDPCTPIHWRSNAARGPVGGLAVLKESVAKIAAITGTTWVYDGATTTAPSTSYLPKTPARAYQPVLLGWTDGTASDLLRGKPARVLGMTRTVWFGTDDGRGHRAAATRAATVALDRTDKLPLRGATSWSTTVLHELGHVMGLDHPTDARQLMAATLPAAATDLQTGDRTGLGRIGKAAGCVSVPGA